MLPMENNIVVDGSEINASSISEDTFSGNSIRITDYDGETLLEIHRDGTVDGYLENVSEAAEIFVREIRYLFGGNSG